MNTKGRDRTGTPLRETDFESVASTNSATLACVHKKHLTILFLVVKLFMLSKI